MTALNRRFTRLPCPLLLALSLCVAPFSAHALDIAVTKTTDSQDGTCDSDCSLREAVSMASSIPGSHRIQLPAGTYQLSIAPPTSDDPYYYSIYDEDLNQNGDLDVQANLTVVGAGSERTIIDGSGIDRIFEVMEGAQLSLASISLQRGRHTVNGGAIYNRGNLKVRQTLFYGNAIARTDGSTGAEGGAIASSGELTVMRSRFIRNFVSGSDMDNADGGAIHNTGVLFVRDTVFEDNGASQDDGSMGGAIFNSGGADIARASFIDNHASVDGGAVGNVEGGVIKLSNATFSGNWTYEDGGAVSNGRFWETATARPSSMTLIHVTITDNPEGHGILNTGTLLIRNSIVVGNSNTWSGHKNCLNRGPNARLTARGMLLGAGTEGTPPSNCFTDMPLVDDTARFTTIMYPLADNNSTLPTHALRRGSPAVDTAVGSCATHDQRGSSRPRDGDGDGTAVCDLGAYERPKF